MRAIQSVSASQNAQIAADLALSRGDASAEAQNARSALTDAQAAVSEDPLSANALNQLATIRGALGQPAAARAALIQATRVQPENAQPFFLLGQYLLTHRDFAAAVKPLARANRLDITDALCQKEDLAAARARHPAVSCVRSA